jgi:hypothetical protein
MDAVMTKSTETKSAQTKSTDKPDQSERALRTLLYAMIIGILSVVIYAIESRSWTGFVTTVSTGIVVAAAALTVGGLLGFLFGIPRTLQQAGAAPPNRNPRPGNGQAAGEERPEYQANTNLEQISDWLTKILVGVGLTQVREIGDKFLTLSGSVSRALGNTSGNRSFALSLILFFLVVGFLFSYLWTRLYLPGAFREKDQALLRSLEDQVKLAVTTSRNAQATSLGTGKGTGQGDPEEVKKQLLAAADGIQPGSLDDPWKGRFGGQDISNDRALRAEVKPIPGSRGLYSIRLTVSSLHPDTNPLKGAVQFFLHPTFTDPKPVVPVGPNGVAELNLKAWGAFTVGAIADDGQTKLELDLSQLESAPIEFRNR